MDDLIRCPACRGAKQMPKLGGVIGECNTCKGKGQIKASDKPVPVVVAPVESVESLINAVSDCVPASTVEEKFVVEVLEKPADVKIDPKKALYRKKRG